MCKKTGTGKLITLYSFKFDFYQHMKYSHGVYIKKYLISAY